MTEESFGKKFATIAVQKGFITKEKFLEAMDVKSEKDLEDLESGLIGAVLYKLGYMTVEQISEVLSDIKK